MDENDTSSDWASSDHDITLLEEFEDDISLPCTKNEISLNSCIINDSLPYTIVPDQETISPLGIFKCISENRYIIITHTSTCSPLMPGSILSLKDRTVIGSIFDVFGPVHTPFYSIIISSNIPILTTESPIYYIHERSTFIDSKSLRTKGSDASNQYDEEPNESELEYSDDNEEQSSKKKISVYEYEPLHRH